MMDEEMKELILEIEEWIVGQSLGNEMYGYNRCVVCKNTWRTIERHNLGCFVPRFKDAIEKLPNPNPLMNPNILKGNT